MADELLSTEKKNGICRICGKKGKLTIEHIIPKVAGGDRKIKVYNVFEVYIKGDEAKYQNKQNGLTATTLCRECNNFLGRNYDEDFAKFYNSMNYAVMYFINSQKINDLRKLNGRFLSGKLEKIKICNVAKRILASFCSIESIGLIKQYPEIKKAILDKKYKPNTDGFELFMCLNTSDDTIFPRLVAITNDNKCICYAGLETGFLSFYFKDTRGELDKLKTFRDCLNITNWLTDYEADKEYNFEELTLPFYGSSTLNIPIPNKK